MKWHRLKNQVINSGVKYLRPREVVGAALLISYHFLARGALFGVNQQLDADMKKNHAAAAVALCALFILCLVTSGSLQLGFLLILISPLWLYAFPRIPDIVLEHRAYITLIGVGFLGAWSAERALWPTAFLLMVYAAATVQRNVYWESRFNFWRRAMQECPDKLRPQINFAVALSKEGRQEEAAEVYRRIIDKGHTERDAGLAAANLSLLYIHFFNTTQNQVWVQKCAELLHHAAIRWPNHPRIRHNRGALFMGFGRWNEAIDEFSRAIQHHPKFSESWRNRARCWGKLGDAAKAQADADVAEQLDGIKGVLRFQ